MPRYKKRRYTRRTRRAKRKSRSGSNKLATKKDVNNAIVRKMENKRVTDNNIALQDSSELDYLRYNVLSLITPGVTIQGRIGNSVLLTGIGIKYKFKNEIEIGQESSALRPGPVTLHLYLVSSKNGFYNPEDTFYNTFATGQNESYQILDDASINDGRRTICTDMLRVHGHHQRTIQITMEKPTAQITGSYNVRFKKPKKCKFIQNYTTGNELGTYTPNIFLIGFFYTGIVRSFRDPALNYAVDLACTTYYKD